MKAVFTSNGNLMCVSWVEQLDYDIGPHTHKKVMAMVVRQFPDIEHYPSMSVIECVTDSFYGEYGSACVQYTAMFQLDDDDWVHAKLKYS